MRNISMYYDHNAAWDERLAFFLAGLPAWAVDADGFVKFMLHSIS
jgi:hypothetical protein